MGATMEEEEFMDIILSSLPPSYEAIMNALTTLIEECNWPIKLDNILRVLKAQYDKKKAYRNSQDTQVFMAKQSKGALKDNKAHIYALIAIKRGIPKSNAGWKEVDRKVRDPNNIISRNPKRKNRRKGHI
jgi:hypothetical protein